MCLLSRLAKILAEAQCPPGEGFGAFQFITDGLGNEGRDYGIRRLDKLLGLGCTATDRSSRLDPQRTFLEQKEGDLFKLKAN